jgi:hypothetical protein
VKRLLDPQIINSETDSHEESEKRPAETPHSVSRPPKEKRLNRSTFLGYLLYLQRQHRLSEEQERFVIRLQSKANLEELAASIDLLTKLSNSERSAARAKMDLELAFQRCGRIPAKSKTPEVRRIGVGYRDKGALRPTHRPHAIGSEAWWSEDLAPALLVQPEEPCWISSEELFGMKRYSEIQELALRQVFAQKTQTLLPIYEVPEKS